MTITLISICAVIILLLVIAASQSNAFAISREIIINRPIEEVFDFVKHIKNMEQYNKWVMTDPAQKTSSRGTDGTPGYTYAWDSQNKNAGKGEQEIKAIIPNQKVDLEIRFEKPFKGVSYAAIVTEPASSGHTKVSYQFKGDKNYGMKLAHMLFNLEKVLGKDLDTTLKNLKMVLEK